MGLAGRPGSWRCQPTMLQCLLCRPLQSFLLLPPHPERLVISRASWQPMLAPLPESRQPACNCCNLGLVIHRGLYSALPLRAGSGVTAVTSPFSGSLLAGKVPQKKVCSVPTCLRLPLVNTRLLGIRLCLLVHGRWGLPQTLQFLLQTPESLLSGKCFPRPAAHASNSRKLFQGSSQAPQRCIENGT